jgi:hypothetical protein
MQESFKSEEENDEEQFEDLNTENEIKKIKLALEHGMDLSKPLADTDMPPEIESQFLDYVQQWEDEMAKGKMTLVYELVNRPPWKPEAQIADEEITVELEKMLELLHNNSLHIDTISEVDDRELYRFITEELFNKETNDIRIPGMMHCYIYEEYHPNHEYDVKNRCNELVARITNKEKAGEETSWCLAKTIRYGNKNYSEEELSKKLINFRDAFSSFTVHEFEFASININEAKNKAEVMGQLHYTGVIDGSYETIDFEGACTFELKRDEEWWEISAFTLPGVVVS